MYVIFRQKEKMCFHISHSLVGVFLMDIITNKLVFIRKNLNKFAFIYHNIVYYIITAFDTIFHEYEMSSCYM